jgi:hypothetical protein
MTTPEQTRRLAFVKYPLSLGNNLVKQPEPLASAALLNFHDAVEFFLQLASEHLDIGKNKIEFLEYWDLLNVKLASPGLPQREAMRRLNKARVALKHHGTHPSRMDVDDFAATVNRFFETSTPIVFGVSLDSVSLLDFVTCEAARLQLAEAVKALEAGEAQKCAEQCAYAFDDLIRDYENRKRSRHGRSPFFFGEDMTFSSSFHMRLDGHGQDRELARFVDNVKNSIEAMQKTIKILAFGLDYKRFTRFQMLLPEVVHFIGGNRDILYHSLNPYVVPERKDLQFCIDFIIETALKLQEFDFEISGEKFKPQKVDFKITVTPSDRPIRSSPDDHRQT